MERVEGWDHGSRYCVAPLDDEGIERAFSLVSPFLRCVERSRWRAFCVGRDPAGRGLALVCARDREGVVRGLAGAHEIEHARHGPLLAVPLVVAASSVDAPGVAGAMIGALTRTARDRGLGGVAASLAALEPAAAARIMAGGVPDGRHGVLLPVARRAG